MSTDWGLRAFIFGLEDLEDDEKELCFNILDRKGFSNAKKRRAFFALNDADLQTAGISELSTRKALRLAIEGSLPDAAGAAGPAGGTLATATAGRAESSDRATVVARYSVTDNNFRSVFTPLRPRVLVTHRHGSHASWKPGTRVKVLVNDVNADKPRQVECKVLGCHEQADVVFCITDEDLDAPDLDVGVAPGARYLLLGCSNRSQDKPYSVSYGVISTTVPDSNGHVRGDTPSVPGDSGAGCFSEETGKLFAINVGRDHKNGDRAVLVPVASLLALLRTHAGAPALMCDWGPGE